MKHAVLTEAKKAILNKDEGGLKDVMYNFSRQFQSEASDELLKVMLDRYAALFGYNESVRPILNRINHRLYLTHGRKASFLYRVGIIRTCKSPERIVIETVHANWMLRSEDEKLRQQTCEKAVKLLRTIRDETTKAATLGHLCAGETFVGDAPPNAWRGIADIIKGFSTPELSLLSMKEVFRLRRQGCFGGIMFSALVGKLVEIKDPEVRIAHYEHFDKIMDGNFLWPKSKSGFVDDETRLLCYADWLKAINAKRDEAEKAKALEDLKKKAVAWGIHHDDIENKLRLPSENETRRFIRRFSLKRFAVS